MHMHHVCVQKLFSNHTSYLWVGALSACLALNGSVTPVAASELTLKQRVDAHLQAGEFIPAIDTALSADHPGDKDLLLANVISTMNVSGANAASNSTSRLMKNYDDRQQVRSSTSVSKMLNGTSVDFGTLMTLIQQETNSMWFDIDGEGGTMSPYINGIKVDPQGILLQQSKNEFKEQLSSIQQQVTKASLNEDISQSSNLRMVSLTRLEQEIAAQMLDGRDVVESMQNLAGLTEIKYVFFYPESQEIVVAGPAEGWTNSAQGWAMGLNTSKPVLQLDDLVTLLRTFSDKGMKVFGCSINPRPESMKELKEFVEVSLAKGPLNPGQTAPWVKALEAKLGMQDIEIYGVPSNSRVARVIIEADYRMKLIGIGKLEGGSNIPDYFQLSAKNPTKTSSIDALRWWLTLQCDKVLSSPEHTAYEVRGSKVLCQSENQYITAQGQHVAAGKTDDNNKLFAANFTAHFEELSNQDPVFADMKNIFDLAYVAAIIHQEREANRHAWNPATFLNNDGYPTATYETPLTVHSVANHRITKDHQVVVQVAGGVQADVRSLLKNPATTEVSPRLNEVAKTNHKTELPPRRWWWDAAN